MAKLYNLARMTTATTGTGTITLGAAVSGYLSFAGAGATNGDTISYAIKDGSNSEIGTGTYTTAGTTLTRTVTKSTNANTAINLSGTAEVFITPRAEDLITTNGAVLQASPSNPTATTSTTGVMMGIGPTCTLTPIYSSRIKLEFYGQLNNSGSGNVTTALVKYGTGTAPVNGAAPTGTSLGTSISVAVQPANYLTAYAGGGIITGLTAGVAYWFDIQLLVNAGTGSVQNISCSAIEC